MPFDSPHKLSYFLSATSPKYFIVGLFSLLPSYPFFVHDKFDWNQFLPTSNLSCSTRIIIHIIWHHRREVKCRRQDDEKKISTKGSKKLFLFYRQREKSINVSLTILDDDIHRIELCMANVEFLVGVRGMWTCCKIRITQKCIIYLINKPLLWTDPFFTAAWDTTRQTLRSLIGSLSFSTHIIFLNTF